MAQAAKTFNKSEIIFPRNNRTKKSFARALQHKELFDNNARGTFRQWAHNDTHGGGARTHTLRGDANKYTCACTSAFVYNV